MISTTIIKSASALVFSLYGRPGAVDVSWAYRENGVICWAVVKIDGFWYLILRGSVTRDDWLHDFEALAMLQRLHEQRGGRKRIEGARIEPGDAAPERRHC